MNHKQGNVIYKYEALWFMVIQACFNKESTFSLYLDYTWGIIECIFLMYMLLYANKLTTSLRVVKLAEF